MQSWTAKGRDVEQGSVRQRPVRLERPLDGEFRVRMNSLLFIALKGQGRVSHLGGSLFSGEPNQNKNKLGRNVNHFLKAAGFSCSPAAQVVSSKNTCSSGKHFLEGGKDHSWNCLMIPCWIFITLFLQGKVLHCLQQFPLPIFPSKVTKINKTN